MVPARYSRQVLFGGLAASGQRALIDATVVVVGCGGLGCMQATLLVRAGVGRVRIIDRDLVETIPVDEVAYSLRDALRICLQLAKAEAPEVLAPRPEPRLVETAAAAS